MKISIITASYNNQDTIEKTLLSVKSQTYKDIEHIIIDGASNDNTLSIVNKYSYISKVISEKDNGIYYALNKGIEVCTGDVVGFLHSDDFFPNENILQKIADIFLIKNCDAIYGDIDYVSADETEKIIRHWKSGNYDFKKLRKGWMPPHPTFYVKKDFYKKLGLFDTNFKIAADYDLMLRFLKNGLNLNYLPEVIVKMRIGGMSNNNLKNIIQKSKEDYKAIKKNGIGGLYTLVMKNISKISQFWIK